MAGLGRAQRKRRTRQHIIADLSVNHVERFIFRCGFAAEITRHDYGIDMMLFFYGDDGAIRDGQVLIQLKASDSLKVVEDRSAIAFRVDRRDLNFWLGLAQPVILIVYDARKDRAHWLYVQAAIGSERREATPLGGRTVTIRLPLKNVLSE